VEGYFGPVEDAQEFGLSPMQPGEQAIEKDIAGLAFEDAVEAGAQCPCPTGIGVVLVGFEVLVEPQDQDSDQFHRLAVSWIGGGQLMDQSLGMGPAEGVVGERYVPLP
jgi:hypothetical protein